MHVQFSRAEEHDILVVLLYSCKTIVELLMAFVQVAYDVTVYTIYPQVPQYFSFLFVVLLMARLDNVNKTSTRISNKKPLYQYMEIEFLTKVLQFLQPTSIIEQYFVRITHYIYRRKTNKEILFRTPDQFKLDQCGKSLVQTFFRIPQEEIFSLNFNP